ncbi:CNNM domain-containing protein [Glutamicibacter nicotianae]
MGHGQVVVGGAQLRVEDRLVDAQLPSGQCREQLKRPGDPLLAGGVDAALARTVSVAIALVLATVLTMVFGELVPKNLAIAKPFATAMAVVGFQRGFSTVT